MFGPFFAIKPVISSRARSGLWPAARCQPGRQAMAREGGDPWPKKLKAHKPTSEEGARLLIVRRGHKYKATTHRRAGITTA